MSFVSLRLATAAVALLAAAPPVVAGPYLAPGDVSLRSDLQLLNDIGAINIPLSTWPISWGEVHSQIGRVSDRTELSVAELAALEAVEQAAHDAVRNQAGLLARFAAASDPYTFRGFEKIPREEGELAGSIFRTGDRVAWELKVTAVANPTDGKNVRFDDSFLGVAAGNWMISAGYQSRWWGPGWSDSLIFSTNARPVPGIAAQRNGSDPFDIPGLRWLGPWNLVVFFGQLEHDRAVPEAQMWGLRTVFKPKHNLEVGLSRSAQWCGEGRPCDLETFWNLLIGRDNVGEIPGQEEPGNQLAAVDVRWGRPFGAPMAFYTQWTAEDEAGNLPSRWIGMAGLEFFGYLDTEVLSGRWRAHVELADTTLEFYESAPRFDSAYEHSIYQSGYRYRNRVMGHTLDNDARALAAGLLLTTAREHDWNLTLRAGELNRGGVRPNPVAPHKQDLFLLGITHTRSFSFGAVRAGLEFDTIDDKVTGASDDEIRGFVDFTWNL